MKPTINKHGYSEREVKFEIAIRMMDGTGEIYKTIKTLDELLHPLGINSWFNEKLYEIVYKRQFLGYNDKEGAELIEGDIVSIPTKDRPFAAIETKTRNWVIGWGT